MPLLKEYLLIHVDCTELLFDARNELFMASRDRLKRGDIFTQIRKRLINELVNSELKDIHKLRRESFNSDSSDPDQILKEIVKKLPINKKLTDLLQKSLGIPTIIKKPVPIPHTANTRPKKIKEFEPNYFPTFFEIKGGDYQKNGIPCFKLPKGGNRYVIIATDAPNDYLDRSADKGELVLKISKSDSKVLSEIDDADSEQENEKLDISQTDPYQGNIRFNFNTTSKAQVGDLNKMEASLSTMEGTIDQEFYVEIVAPEAKEKKQKKQPEQNFGFPSPILCSKDGRDGTKRWDELGNLKMNHSTIVKLLNEDTEEESKLPTVLINIDSAVLMDFQRNKSEKAMEFAKNHYISAVFLHSTFLYVSTKAGFVSLNRPELDSEENISSVEIEDYISEIFSTTYAQFLLNFDTSTLLDTLSEN